MRHGKWFVAMAFLAAPLLAAEFQAGVARVKITQPLP